MRAPLTRTATVAAAALAALAVVAAALLLARPSVAPSNGPAGKSAANEPRRDPSDSSLEGAVAQLPAPELLPQRRRRSLRYPPRSSVNAAVAFAEAAPGRVAFAVIGARGRIRGVDINTEFSSASASKVLLLAAELRRARTERTPIDEATRSLLGAMIIYSDNAAADQIYSRVGDAGMTEVARRAGMRSFRPIPGYWGGAQVTAADLARFYWRLGANLVGPDRRFARGLLAAAAAEQRWGIPAAAGPGWTIWFKGGWRPQEQENTSGPVTHQAGLLRHQDGTRVALAVLTDQLPGSSSYATIEGIAARLLHPPPGLWTRPLRGSQWRWPRAWGCVAE